MARPGLVFLLLAGASCDELTAGLLCAAPSALLEPCTPRACLPEGRGQSRESAEQACTMHAPAVPPAARHPSKPPAPASGSRSPRPGWPTELSMHERMPGMAPYPTAMPQAGRQVQRSGQWPAARRASTVCAQFEYYERANGMCRAFVAFRACPPCPPDGCKRMAGLSDLRAA
jgi:hypothetical protein